MIRGKSTIHLKNAFITNRTMVASLWFTFITFSASLRYSLWKMTRSDILGIARSSAVAHDIVKKYVVENPNPTDGVEVELIGLKLISFMGVQQVVNVDVGEQTNKTEYQYDQRILHNPTKIRSEVLDVVKYSFGECSHHL